MIAYAVHLVANAVYPSEAPDVHDGICSTFMIWTKTDEAIASSVYYSNYINYINSCNYYISCLCLIKTSV